MAMVLGAVGGRGLVARRRAIAGRPIAAVQGCLAALAGIVAGGYVHVAARAGVAGARGLPPLRLVFQVDDFARIVPLIPALLLLAAVRSPAPGRGRHWMAPVIGFTIGLAGALVAGIAALIPAALGMALGPLALLVLGAVALGAVWLIARGTRE